MSYKYMESGLDNIYLENGYDFHDTAYGEGVSVRDTGELHKVIALWLIGLIKPLNGAELRFLRLEMEMTQRDLAAILGTTEQTLRLWEKQRRKDMPGPADRLLRALYKEYATGDGSIRGMVERLAELDQSEEVEAHLTSDDCQGWHVTARVV